MKQPSIKLNAILNTVKTVLGVIFPLITFPYVSRVLLPENIGKVNFGSSFVSYFSLIASLGIATYAIRECSANRNNKDKLSKTASQIFSINICTTVVAYILMITTLLLFRQFDSYRTLIIIQSMTILFTTFGCDWLNSAMEDFVFITTRTIVFQILSLILMFAFVHEAGDYNIYAAITVIAASGANIVNVFYRKKYCNIKFVAHMDWKRHFKPIVLLFVMILAQTIFNSSDITMLGLMKGDYEVGIYSSAVKIKGIISQVVSSLAWVIMPRMSYYFENQDYSQINKMLRKALSALLLIGLPCTVGVSCLSEEIILIIAGETYIEAASALVILMVGFSFSLVGGSFLGNMVLLPSKREAVYMIICVISTIVNLILNYFLIPVFGVNAAAGTTAFSGLLVLILLIIAKDKRIRIDDVKGLAISPIIGSLLIIFVCLGIKALNLSLWITTILCVVISILFYFAIQILMKNSLILEMLALIRKKLTKK